MKFLQAFHLFDLPHGLLPHYLNFLDILCFLRILKNCRVVVKMADGPMCID
jgi:hypothetical protein